MDQLLSRPEDMAMHMNRQRMMMSQQQKFPLPPETDHLMQVGVGDGSLSSLSSMGMLPMSLGHLSQLQLHQINTSMLQSLAPPPLHSLGAQMQLHQMHSMGPIAFQQQPNHLGVPSMVVVGPSHTLVDTAVPPPMESAVIDPPQPLEVIVSSASVGGVGVGVGGSGSEEAVDEADLAQKKQQKALKGACKPPFNCAHCGKVYNKKYHLTRHERCHNNVKPYTCPHCPKAFVESGDLKKHVRVHTHDRPYKCVACPATFTQSSSLRVHERVHKGVRYTCEQCHHQFTRNYFLQQHKRRHVGGLDKEYVGTPSLSPPLSPPLRSCGHEHVSLGHVGVVNVPHPHHVPHHSSDAEAAAVVVQAVQVLQSVERVEMAAAVSGMPMVPSVPVQPFPE